MTPLDPHVLLDGVRVSDCDFSINPDDHGDDIQMMTERVVYHLQDAPIAHPMAVMNDLALDRGFRIIDSVPQSIADQWWFWIEWSGEKTALPAYVTEAGWLPVGSQ